MVTDDAGTRRRCPLVLGAILWAVLMGPLLVGLASFTSPRWYPTDDLAQAELRVRDVGTPDTPLIGPIARIGGFADRGSHPGPMVFFALAPAYRLLGSSALALAASTLLVHAVAVGLSLWLALRRGGIGLMAGLAVALALLTRSLGPAFFLEPWNPYLASSWWLVFLLAVWSILDDDVAVLPVAVFAGSFCAQSHLGYLGLVGGLAGLTVARLGVGLWRGRRGDEHGSGLGLGCWRSVVSSVALGSVLWIPAIIDQISGTGNVGRIVRAAQEPEGPVAGLVSGSSGVLHAMDPRWLYGHSRSDQIVATATVPWTTVGLLVAWLGLGALAWAGSPRSLRRLHLTVGVALALAMVSGAGVTGGLWQYVLLWTKPLSLLLVVATGWSAALVARHRLPQATRVRLTNAMPVAAGLILVLATAFALNADRAADPAATKLSQGLGQVTSQTVAALDTGQQEGGGRQGRYLVRWEDPVAIGAQGIGLLNELERAGFEVGVDAPFGAGATRHRILESGDATAVVQLATGSSIDKWQAQPGAVEVAFADVRPVHEQLEFDRLMRFIDEELRSRGLDDLADEAAINLFTASIRADVPEGLRSDMEQARAIGVPVAVFVLPVPTA